MMAKLDMDAIDNLYKGNHNLTVIQCAICFENYVYTILHSKQISKTKISKLKKREECGCFVGIYQVCTTGMSDVFNLNYGETPVFKAFYENVISKRNKLVHGDILNELSKEEAGNACVATTKAIQRLNEMFEGYS